MVLLSLPRCPPRLESNLTVDKNILLPTLQTCRNDIEMKLKWGQLGKLFSCILYHVINILRCQPVPCIGVTLQPAIKLCHPVPKHKTVSPCYTKFTPATSYHESAIIQ